MANRLAGETSPYLLQHKDNPVDWLPWGPEASDLARERDVPILLSIGYAACHWCHVMERESFTDADTAAYMNEHFVPVKVDREERPDVDAIYMEALQGMTGGGGWPLTAFCDPEGVPFHCGTYFPPEPRGGMPSFQMVMEAVVDAWGSQRDKISLAAGRTREQLGAIGRMTAGTDELDPAIPAEAVQGLIDGFDEVNGGFGSAPKFPPASALDLLLARGIHAPVELTLDAMAGGGIHDQLGGGFSRYSVDAGWIVPHFEKMLYDNGLLARTYLRAHLELGQDRHRDVAVAICDWALREMQAPEGGFYSAIDADSEGVEGLFYTWTPAEAEAALAEAGLEPAAAEVLSHLGVSERGQLEGRSVLHLPGGSAAPAPAGFEEARAALLVARERRVRPALDDKRICSWNALMAGSLAEVGAALGEPRYIEAARRCIRFVLDEMRDAEGRLLRAYNDGRAPLNGYLEDHAYLLEALLTLYEATFEVRWYEEARAIAETMIDRFADTERGGFFTTAHDHEELIARRKDLDDHPAPSGNASAAQGLLRLAALSGEPQWEEHARGVMLLLAEPGRRHPQGFAYLLGALDRHLAPSREVALVGPPGEPEPLAPLAAAVRSRYRPYAVLAGGAAGDAEPPLLADRPAADGRALAYVCEGFACKAPVATPAELLDLLA
ncbi:MAG TPA: thioredoxin domain-containing protein [Solirubrobacterales bacterium]|nr:thioredoxin domain-containing protein [Solirubrobacterales bacterium]